MTRLVTGGLLVLLLACTAAPAWGQVAATGWVPVGVRFVHPGATGLNRALSTPDNPAALVWALPAHLMLGATTTGYEDTLLAATASMSGTTVGTRLGGERGMFALSSYATKSAGAALVFEDSLAVLQLAFRPWQTFGLGFSSESGNIVKAAGATEFDRTSLGFSWQMGEDYYFGAALAQDTLNDPLATPVVGNRSGQMVGLAYRSMGSYDWYISYDYMNMPDFDFGTPVGGYTSAALALQVSDRVISWGLSWTTVTEPSVVRDITSRSFDFAYRLSQSFQASIQIIRSAEVSATVDAVYNTSAAMITWEF